MTVLWTPITVGQMTLRHRLAMAPMTRSRAKADGRPGDLAAEYYAQRASMGLLISEGTQPSDDGQGYITTPGIYTDAHVEAWRQVTRAVHDKGAHFFIQLMHVGRTSHPDNTPHHRQPVAPSAIQPKGEMFTAKGMLPLPKPRALTLGEIGATIADFRLAARKAIEAGADGVELHGANGYLIQQFFAPNANIRTDLYGGPIENRIRFALEATAAVADEIGANRTAIRISPGNTLGDIDEGAEGPALYRRLVTELDKLGLAYLHVLHRGDDAFLAELRSRWHGVLMLNRGGRPRDVVGQDVASRRADMESLASMSLANPDLVDRLRSGAPLNTPDRTTFYGGDSHGYTDYPTLEQASGATA